jgi:hypothetical protein
MSHLSALSNVLRAVHRSPRRPRIVSALHATIDGLERRTLLSSAPQASFTDFSSTAGLVANGFGGTAITSNSRLRMTDGIDHEARSVWFGTSVPIVTFRTDFRFRSNADPDSADGLTFTVQNGPTTAVGAGGLDLGYTGIDHSEAVAFNLFNLQGFGSNFGFASNGEQPGTNTDMSPLDLHSGHVFLATVSYDGTTMRVAVSDASDRSKMFSASKPIDLPAAIGSDTAIVGFTASTGDSNATQYVTSWNFAGHAALPTIATDAAAAPNPVTAKTAVLSVLGADSAGESNLTYTWSLVRKPSGARTPTFSVNETNNAKSTTATFYKDGIYRFLVTVTNQDQSSATSGVVVAVRQTATAVRITPHKQVIRAGATLQYHATIVDQFNRALRTQPEVTFSVQGGSGSIDADTGLFTASSSTRGHVYIVATASDLTGGSGATVIG